MIVQKTRFKSKQFTIGYILIIVVTIIQCQRSKALDISFCSISQDNKASYTKEKRGEKPFSERSVYKNPLFSIDSRVTDLLSRMTLEEKIGQMNMPSVYLKQLGKDIDSKRDGCLKFAKGTKEQGIGPGGGFFTLPNTILHEGPRQQAEFHNELQRMAIENTRLGIPLLMTEEGTHGLACSGGTIFPEGLALGSTWNMDMVKHIYGVAAREARAIGIHQLFTLVVEPNRDPRLGRNEEGYSEDPYLCSCIAGAIVTGAQGADVSAPDKVIAGLCHFPGQSQPVGGLERGAMDVSERKLREVFLPPWVEGISKNGALGVMATYPAINGVPAHSSEKLLTKTLREELGFEGIVLGEGRGITSLVYEHAVSSQKEAGAVALKAGVDVGISYEGGFMESMKENISEGRVNVSLIDRSVSRILRQKFRLGLFENPYVDTDHAVKVSNSAENRELALQAAREGIVLLKNENGLLPLHRNIQSIAVIGPNADDERNQLGDYTSRIILQNVVTVLEGIKNKVSSNTRITYVKGCNVIGPELDEIKNAAEAAKKADVAIVVVGESHAGEKTDGEGYDVASLDLTGLQEDLMKAVHATGTPTVAVLINGRPLSVRWTAENIPAIIEAWNCGEQGGNAVADVLFGDYNPDGRLPITFPRHVGQLPVYYNYMPSKSYWINSGMGKAYVDVPASPLWKFGFGLSYTTFEYSNLQITPEEIGSAGEISISVDIKNTGKKDSKEVVQLYVNDVISSVSKPVKELKGFEKINLAASEKKTVRFKLTPEHLSLLEEHLEPVVEPGIFEVMIGSSSEDIRLFGKFKVVFK
jgi:beta-glucosidase